MQDFCHQQQETLIRKGLLLGTFPKTNMTWQRKIHHEWRCNSYWTSRFALPKLNEWNLNMMVSKDMLSCGRVKAKRKFPKCILTIGRAKWESPSLKEKLGPCQVWKHGLGDPGCFFFHGLLLTSVQCWTSRSTRMNYRKVTVMWSVSNKRSSSSLILKDLSSSFSYGTWKSYSFISRSIWWLFFIWYIMLDLDCPFRCTSLPATWPCFHLKPQTHREDDSGWLRIWPSKFSELLLTVASLRESKLVQKMTWFGMRNLSNRFQWQVKIYRNPCKNAIILVLIIPGGSNPLNHYKGL